MPKRPAVFVDRDGVLIREVNYLRRPEQVQVLAGAAEGIAALRKAGFRVVLITNQSGVGRGYFTLKTVALAHARLKADLAKKKAKLDAIYFCPHHPDAGCRCRKPKPYMLQKAARDLKLDLPRSFFVGDTTSDLACAAAAKVTGILVRTGKGGRDGKASRAPYARRTRNLATAARWILRRSR